MSNAGKSALDYFVHARRFGLTDAYVSQCENPNIAPIMAVPAMVLSSFASELYLKCLHKLTAGKAPRGHNLVNLFRNLPTETRVALSRRWDEYVPTVEDELQATEKHTGDKIPRDLTSHMALGAKAFSNLRYPGEFNSQSFFIGELPRILDACVIQLKPEWKAMWPTQIVNGENIP